jgi:hypothetical protein
MVMLPSLRGLEDVRRSAYRGAYVIGLGLVLLALVAPGACLPHSHSGVGAGIFNEDHDLSILATSSSAAPLPVSAPLFVDTVAAPVCAAVRPVSAPFVTRDAESRAPPAA